ncbi:uncharacterized protein EV420DRAFT_1476149 [Desarmillaria tabescens]|uniref:Uncharacterized protein n=1 Tax=Armillaria tabescens TaxID=1929756 RepID=A0AA39TVQ3_ARMTA|nr:uncharacterized protein EV420DRAFT_1476149 [Desarmillaria tabescens]KAK0464759.1 hypothetical protein EV420DRAFT_1476149 [Desarmillaria tabescens]
MECWDEYKEQQQKKAKLEAMELAKQERKRERDLKLKKVKEVVKVKAEAIFLLDSTLKTSGLNLKAGFLESEGALLLDTVAEVVEAAERGQVLQLPLLDAIGADDLPDNAAERGIGRVKM